MRAPREIFPLDSNLLSSEEFLLESDSPDYKLESPLEE